MRQIKQLIALTQNTACNTKGYRGVATDSGLEITKMKNKMKRWQNRHSNAMLGFAVFFGVMGFSQVAHADLRVCNDTKSLVGAALGYREDGKWFTEGWWQIPGETCASIIKGTLSARFYYIYAEDADKGGQWRGDVFMCTSDKEFHIEGVKDCFARGHEKNGFFEVDTGDKKSWMIRLSESGQSGSAE